MIRTSSIHTALDREVRKLIRRHNEATFNAALNLRRYTKRSGQTGAKPSSLRPAHWEVDAHFDPFYVRSRMNTIGYAIAKKIRDSTYQPKPSLLVEIPKPSGGTRDIAISPVPDAAVSYWLGKRLIDRNSYRFSSYSYAYRSDRNAHHAIQHLKTDLLGRRRVFMLEYDFANYFDSIRHDYVLALLDEHFLVSTRERNVLERIMKGRRARSAKDYGNGDFEIPDVGIPQGSNVSLFLANVACYELDKGIERVGVTFARYADDILVLADSYDKVSACANLLLSHGERSGTEVNLEKSPGISLLTPDSIGEIKSKRSVTFLGHEMSRVGVGVAPRAIARMKRRVSRIINSNLLLQPRRGVFNASRIGQGFYDWDLVTCINELRRYIYGKITEASLSEALVGKGSFNITRCAMAFYPLVDHPGATALRQMDGWLVSTLERAYAKRCKMLKAMGYSVQPLAAEELISGNWYSFPKVVVETRLPSFFKSWRYVRRVADIHGLERFPSPGYDYI